MSASPMARQVTENKSIPKRVLITDPMDMPADYSSTPGGTLFSTTPGGSKIVYERSFLINLRNSPISKTPPKWDIPEGLIRGSPTKCSPTKFSPKESQHKMPKPNSKSATRKCPPNVIKATCIADDQDQFQMDM